MNEFFDTDYNELEDYFSCNNATNLTTSLLYPITPSELTITDYAAQSRGYWMPIPLPEHLVPTSHASLAELSDEDLLNVPVHLLTHIMRTVASGGLQVISPRVVPLARCAGRTTLPHRTEDMYVVGSKASTDTSWPGVEGYTYDPALLGEPLDAGPDPVSHRDKTKVERLIAAQGPIEDPVVKSFVTARSIVDLQRRADINGDAEALAHVISSAWEAPYEDVFSFTEASLAPAGQLLRYAIGVDDKYPALNAPLQAKMCISVGSFGHTKANYGEYAAVDWRRIRVMCEAVFYLATRVEGHSLISMSGDSLPGSMNDPPDRAGVLQFRPMPGSVWTYDPTTFALMTRACDLPHNEIREMFSRKCLARLTETLGTMHPIPMAASVGSRVSIVPSRAITTVSPVAEGIIAGYVSVMKKLHTFTSHGRTSGSAVRAIIYASLESIEGPNGMRAIWAIDSVKNTAMSMSISFSNDVHLVREAAPMLAPACIDLRQKITATAARRGQTLADWWDDLRAMLPWPLNEMAEGTRSWTLATTWLLLNPPTSKWAGVGLALRETTRVNLANGPVIRTPLPAELGSRERVMSAAASALSYLKAKFSAYYGSKADACHLISKRPALALHRNAKDIFVLAGHTWSIRASVASTLSLTDNATMGSMNISGDTVHLAFKTAPYAAYANFRAHLLSLSFVTPSTKEKFPETVPHRVSMLFNGIVEPLCHVPSYCDVFKYVLNPAKLAKDIEKTISQMTADVKKVVLHYESEDREMDWGEEGEAYVMEEITWATDDPNKGPYYYISKMEYPDDEYYAALVESLPDSLQDTLLSKSYASAEEVVNAIREVQIEMMRMEVRETIN
jgi:hypothetical protein